MQNKTYKAVGREFTELFFSNYSPLLGFMQASYNISQIWSSTTLKLKIATILTLATLYIIK